MTTPYDIKISPTAAEQIKVLPSKPRKLVIQLIKALAVNPRPPGVKKIEGMSGLYSEPLGSRLRLIYKIEDQGILLLLVK